MRLIETGHINTRPNFSLGPTHDIYHVIERRRGDVYISIESKHHGKIEFPDFDGMENDFHLYHGTGSDGQDMAEFRPHCVYLSPNYEYIHVLQHLNSTMNVGNVYHRRGQTAAMILLHGLRFDDACVAWYCQHTNIPFASVTKGSGYSRYLFLMAWHGDHVGVFDVAAANYFLNEKRKKSERAIFFRIYFDFARERFLKAHAIKPWR